MHPNIRETETEWERDCLKPKHILSYRSGVQFLGIVNAWGLNNCMRGVYFVWRISCCFLHICNPWFVLFFFSGVVFAGKTTTCQICLMSRGCHSLVFSKSCIKQHLDWRCQTTFTFTFASVVFSLETGWVLLYMHRNHRLIRDRCPGRPPWWLLSSDSLEISTASLEMLPQNVFTADIMPIREKR